MLTKFNQDLAGNTLAVIILFGMLASVFIVGYIFIKGILPKQKSWHSWAILILGIFGLGIAIYLSYVELTFSQVVCGPVGNCNAVQTSQYAYLFGIIPIGVLGALGYIGILSAWLIGAIGKGNLKKYAPVVIWGFSWFGILFSIYLTFLEPFVIGASCIWCLSSAVIMTLMLWVSTPSALSVLQIQDDQDDDLSQANEPV